MDIFGWMTRTARRTFRPYVLLGRYILIFDAVLAFLFVLLMFGRWMLNRSACPITSVPASKGFVDMVQASCHAGREVAGVASNIIDNLAAGLIVAIATSALVWLTSPRHYVDEDIAALEPWNIRPVLDAVLPTTRRYWFRGRSGRFLRTSVMPALDDAGRRESQLRELAILLPDPSERNMLADYAFYRNSLKGEAGKWSADRIRNEILATIITAARFTGANHFLQIAVHLKSDFSLFRLDMADDQLVLSREDPMWPAILCSGRSKFYASYIEEFRNEAVSAKSPHLRSVTVPTPVTGADVQSIVGALNLGVTLTDAEAAEVAHAIEKPDLPYA